MQTPEEITLEEITTVEEITEAQAVAFAEVLAGNATMTSLTLGVTGNQIGAEGVQALAAVLAQNPILTVLNLMPLTFGGSGG